MINKDVRVLLMFCYAFIVLIVGVVLLEHSSPVVKTCGMVLVVYANYLAWNSGEA
ncbi:hypothetical protein [Chroococcidiopsis sp.]|uniref:hypothetical protein n=1 Tax=Chroococcidiopsis sp. TaxID=3088168 RepID=UPI003F35CF6C